MSDAVRQPMTRAEFLEWEERQELRFEYDGFGPVAMAGGTAEHDRIALNLAAALVPRLRGSPCQPHGSNLKVECKGTSDTQMVTSPAPRRRLAQPWPPIRW